MNRYKINIFLFLLLIFSFGIFSIINPQQSAVSQTENRALKSAPVFNTKNLFSVKYFRDFEEYYSDNFPFREGFVKVSSNIKEFGRLSSKDSAEIIIHHGANTAEVEKNTVLTESNTYEAQNKEDYNNQEANISPSKQNKAAFTGKMLIIDGKAMEIHKFNQAASQSYADAINTFQERLKNNAKVYSLLAPTQIEFLKDEKYKNLSSSQKETINFVNSKLNKKITPVNAYDSLEKNSDQYLYFKADHHWTALGAYYGYTSFMNVRNEKAVPLETYQTDKVEDFLGSTYSMTLNKKVENNSDTIYLYKPFTKHQYYIYYEGPLKMDVLDMSHAKQKNKYRIFLSGDRPWGKIVTEVKNGKKIAVIKDSYGNAFVPFLIPHYEEIYIIDPRQFKKNIINFVNENNIGEVLFLNYVLTTQNDDFAGLIRNMMFR